MSDIWYYSNDGQDQKGPVSREELHLLSERGLVGSSTLVWNDSMPHWATFANCFQPSPSPQTQRDFPGDDLNEIADRISYFEIASMVLWSIFGLSMIFLIPGVSATLVGCYNIVMVVLQIPLIAKIQHRKASVVGVYQGITRLIIAGVVNLALGWYLGALLIGFDFYVRHLVLKNRRVFLEA